MPLSAYATTIGLVCLLFGIPMVVSPEKTTHWIFRVMDNDPLIRIIGTLFLVLTVLALQEDPTIGMDVEGLVKLLAWATGIKALIMCWWPEWLCSVSRRMLAQPWCRGLKSAGSLAFGVLLIWAGATLS